MQLCVALAVPGMGWGRWWPERLFVFLVLCRIVYVATI